LLLIPLAAYPQTTLTGAIQFSTNSTGAFSGQVWNTLGGDNDWDLWLALNPDATSPVNGPSDAQAAISIPLEAGKSYTYYAFVQPNVSFRICSSMGIIQRRASRYLELSIARSFCQTAAAL